VIVHPLQNPSSQVSAIGIFAGEQRLPYRWNSLDVHPSAMTLPETAHRGRGYAVL
jgi:hypothetical protein